jgi:hypothetical protein
MPLIVQVLSIARNPQISINYHNRWGLSGKNHFRDLIGRYWFKLNHDFRTYVSDFNDSLGDESGTLRWVPLTQNFQDPLIPLVSGSQTTLEQGIEVDGDTQPHSTPTPNQIIFVLQLLMHPAKSSSHVTRFWWWHRGRKSDSCADAFASSKLRLPGKVFLY